MMYGDIVNNSYNNYSDPNQSAQGCIEYCPCMMNIANYLRSFANNFSDLNAITNNPAMYKSIPILM